MTELCRIRDELSLSDLGTDHQTILPGTLGNNEQSACGSAAHQCGKAPPYRNAILFI
jgi:hypothetical protein